MSTAIEIINTAYRDHNLNEISSFSTAQEFPGNLGLDILNEVIRELNRLGNFWFTETKTALAHDAESAAYSLSGLGVDPKRIIRIQKEADNHWGELKPYNWRLFQNTFRQSGLQTGEPSAWSKFGDTLEISTLPNQDYELYLYHFRDMPTVTQATDSQSSGALLIPEGDEDLLERGCYFYLGYRIGKWDYANAFQMLRMKATPFLLNVHADTGLPTQMPSNF